MNKKTRKETDPSRVTFEGLEQFARAEIQKRLQELLEEELVEFLGRDRSERRAKIDEPRVYRNGHAKPRKLTMSVGTVTEAPAPERTSRAGETIREPLAATVRKAYARSSRCDPGAVFARACRSGF